MKDGTVMKSEKVSIYFQKVEFLLCATLRPISNKAMFPDRWKNNTQTLAKYGKSF